MPEPNGQVSGWTGVDMAGGTVDFLGHWDYSYDVTVGCQASARTVTPNMHQGHISGGHDNISTLTDALHPHRGLMPGGNRGSKEGHVDTRHLQHLLPT